MTASSSCLIILTILVCMVLNEKVDGVKVVQKVNERKENYEKMEFERRKYDTKKRKFELQKFMKRRMRNIEIGGLEDGKIMMGEKRIEDRMLGEMMAKEKMEVKKRVIRDGVGMMVGKEVMGDGGMREVECLRSEQECHNNLSCHLLLTSLPSLCGHTCESTFTFCITFAI